MTETSRQTGIVKWFDNKKGFGMITLMESANKGKDIFAHHSEVHVNVQQYKYLVAGEYVSFNVNHIAGDEAKLTAVDIKGVLDGPVMCETINTEKLLKNAYHSKRRLENDNASNKAAEPVVEKKVAPVVAPKTRAPRNIKEKEPAKKRVSKK
jgi:CspA family cold shock protein